MFGDKVRNHTLSSTLKTKSLFKNYDYKHIDQIDGCTFSDRLTRPGEPIKHKLKHDTELVPGNQERYDDFMHSWMKQVGKMEFNNDINNTSADRDAAIRQSSISKQDSKLKKLFDSDISQTDIYQTMRFRSVMFKNEHQQRSKKKDSVYDYHKKLQATPHLNKNLDKKHILNWKSSCQHATFDKIRGASPEMNSYNNLH